MESPELYGAPDLKVVFTTQLKRRGIKLKMWFDPPPFRYFKIISRLYHNYLS